MSGDTDRYREFVAARLTPLHRTAYLLCGDWHTADDLVSITLTKLYRHWRRVSTMDNVDAYVRRTLLNVWLDERRRPWRRERSGDVPDTRTHTDDPAGRVALLDQLAALPPRRRAVLVLRFYCDLSVEETAGIMRTTPGTVKSQTARALETLRGRLGVDGGPTTGPVREASWN